MHIKDLIAFWLTFLFLLVGFCMLLFMVLGCGRPVRQPRYYNGFVLYYDSKDRLTVGGHSTVQGWWPTQPIEPLYTVICVDGRAQIQAIREDR
jgi:hypothetical protein